MKRRHLVELEDLPWWPSRFRDAATDDLVAAIRHARTYAGLAPRLAAAIKRTSAAQIINLCSEGGGPWPNFLPALRANAVAVPVCLTDKYSNAPALRRVVATTPGARFEEQPVSATEVPARLAGYRTLFTSFHHFRPPDAWAILAASVRFWTYLVPVIPLASLIDGVVSCLRIYTPDEMLAMAREVSGDNYEWEAGLERPRGSPIPIPFLIGVPRTASDGLYPGGTPDSVCR